MRLSSIIAFIEDKAVVAYAAAKPVVEAHMAAAAQARVAYTASLQPAPKAVRKPVARKRK